MTRMNLGRARLASMTAAAAALMLAGQAHAQARAKIQETAAERQIQPEDPSRDPGKVPAKVVQKKPADETNESWKDGARKKTLEIGTQPARDVGVMKRDVPPILAKAASDPYNIKGLKTCKALAAEIASLNGELGPDYNVGNEYKENRVGRLAEAGGKTVVNAIIPFRGLVREVSGAAPAERRMNAALDAGFARRGFLRGVHAKQGCKTTF